MSRHRRSPGPSGPRPASVGRGLLASAFFWFALALLGAEVAARALRADADAPTADRAVRNPDPRRGWPEYLRPADAGEGPLVVLISNSQGVGKELPDADLTYAGRLRAALAGREPPVRVENWSCAGVRAAEVELLTLLAVERGADVVLFALSLENFDPSGRVRLDTAVSDIALLAGWPPLWPGFGDTLVAESSDWDDRLVRTLMLGSALVRSRIEALDRLADALPPRRHRAVFGHRRLTGERLDAPSATGRDERAADVRLFLNLTPEKMRKRRDTFLDVEARLERRFAEAGVRWVWVWIPLDVETLWPGVTHLIRTFREDARRALDVPTFDLLDALPHERFLTTSHLDAEGHARLAERLLPLIDDALP